MSRVESEEFAYRSFIMERIDQLADLLMNDESFRTIQTSPLHADDVYKRAFELAYKPTDDSVRHPDDVALFSYLWFLQRADFLRANALAERLARINNCWWSRRLAVRVLEDVKAISSTNYVITLLQTDQGELNQELSFHVNSGVPQPPNSWIIPVNTGLVAARFG